jgi:hypothetical protein
MWGMDQFIILNLDIQFYQQHLLESLFSSNHLCFYAKKSIDYIHISFIRDSIYFIVYIPVILHKNSVNLTLE